MDTAQWPQEIVVKPIEEIVTNTCTAKPAPSSALERKARPQKEQALNCPRCNSTNTKFCYYNNYSLTQPRYFCKSCRRYWTEGGSLRNIPVGGGSRKNKRSSSLSSTCSSSSSSSNRKLPDLIASPQNPKLHDAQDLNLAFPSPHIRSFSDLISVPSIEINKNNQISSSTTATTTTTTTSTAQLSALELLTGISSRGLNAFMPMPVQDPNSVYNTTGFPLQDFKPTLNFNLDGFGGSTGGGGYGSLQGVQDSSGRLLFPFEDVKQVSNTTEIDQNREHGDSTGYWTGMLGGGSW